MSILKLHSVKNGGSLARNARFDAPTCLVSSLWFSSGLAVSMGEIAKPILLHGVKASCSVLLRQAWHFVTFSCVCKRVESHFVWQVQYFCVVFRRWVAFFVAGAELWRPPSSFWVEGAALRMCCIACSTLHTPHFTLYTPHLTLHL